MTERDDDLRTDAALERDLARLRAAEPAPPADLMARLTADALAAMPAAPVKRPATPPARVGWQDRLAEFFDTFGGWRGGMALASAAAAGLFIAITGIADDLPGAASAYLGETSLYDDGYSGFIDETLSEG